MTYKENITAILECHFGGFKQEIIDNACNCILKLEPCEYAPFTIEELKNEDMQKLLRGFKNQRVLDKIKEEIEEEYGNCDICEWYEDYDYEENDISEYQRVGNVSDILAIIDKYKAESEDKE